MPIPIDLPHGAAIRWIGEPFEDEGGGDVQPGELGTFLGFDGPPGDPEVVVSFPKLTFVAPKENVEPV